MPDDLDQPPRGYNTDDVPTQPPPGRSRPASWLKLALGLIILVPVLLGGAYTWTELHFPDGGGNQTGYVNKFSQEGGLCKRWEGELAMVDIPGAIPEIFRFTVRNDSLAHVITKSKGQNVVITYEEHRGVPTSCFGNTPNYVTSVRSTL
jgi:hypothetical protein